MRRHETLHARILHGHLQRHPEVDLTEAPSGGDLGWIGHAHEIVMPLVSTRPPLPHPDVERAPVFTSRMLPNPGDAQQHWVQAKLFTHPSVMDQILTRRLKVACGRCLPTTSSSAPTAAVCR